MDRPGGRGLRPAPYNPGAADEHISREDYLDTVRVHALTALDFLARE